MMRACLQCKLHCALLCLLATTSLFADPGNHPISMWQVEGQENRVFLLGSIHLLREKDYPISSAIYAAYRDSEALYMELDMDDADPLADQMLANELGLIPGNGSLREVLGPATYAEAEALAAAAKIPLHLLDRAEPWYAAIQVELIMLLRIGFNPLYGIETHLTEMAKSDNKEIVGFESVRQQLDFLDNLSAEAQREMFMQALADSADIASMMDTLIDAWHNGDTTFLEENMLSEMQNFPELNKIIVTNRNLAWTEKIEELLTHDRDYLIVVGAMHLIGEYGVPELLTKQGFEVRQMQELISTIDAE
ncbi:MAG: hypothetical protein ACI88G_000273 [Woeseiaceae bacterium]|jgi:uncharacterized protein YbaP (TraB family)